jgi:DNA-binding winged helix-turn-helix (wHTH) protein
MEENTKRTFRFHFFEADAETGELRKRGRRIALQGQPLEVLLMLLERPGEVVTRAEIHQRLWPEGTFVDFDHSLNTAVNKLRDLLGDSAGNPRFIETLARRGYRFIAPVESMDANSAVSMKTAQSLEAAPTLAPEASTGGTKAASGLAEFVLTRPEEVPAAPPRLMRALFLLLQVMYLCFYVTALLRLGAVGNVVSTVPYALFWVVLIVLTAVAGIPTRLYLIATIAFDVPGSREKFLRLFPLIFPLDELWALAPFLLAHRFGAGLALGITAALLYVPFAQRSLILMGAGSPVRVSST